MTHTVQLTESLVDTVNANIKQSDLTLNEKVEQLVNLGLQLHASSNDNTFDADSDLDSLADDMWAGSPEWTPFFDKRIEQGQGVGLDENDNLVYQRDLNQQ
jgi:hypothetical protein